MHAKPLTSAPPLSRRAATRAITVSTLLAPLVGCSLPTAPEAPTLYTLPPPAADAGTAPPGAAPLLLGDVLAASVWQSTALHYRRLHVDAAQLLPYAQSRWAQPPTVALRDRVAARLSALRPVLRAGDSSMVPPTALGSTSARPTRPLALRLELHEFAQHFQTPQQSQAVLAGVATWFSLNPGGGFGPVLAQTPWRHQQAAPSADASGGVVAFAQAIDQLASTLVQQLQALDAAAR